MSSGLNLVVIGWIHPVVLKLFSVTQRPKWPHPHDQFINSNRRKWVLVCFTLEDEECHRNLSGRHWEVIHTLDLLILLSGLSPFLLYHGPSTSAAWHICSQPNILASAVFFFVFFLTSRALTCGLESHFPLSHEKSTFNLPPHSLSCMPASANDWDEVGQPLRRTGWSFHD